MSVFVPRVNIQYYNLLYSANEEIMQAKYPKLYALGYLLYVSILLILFEITVEYCFSFDTSFITSFLYIIIYLIEYFLQYLLIIHVLFFHVLQLQ